MTEMIRDFICFIGFHAWVSVQGKMQPTRECVHCKQRQGLFRGAGADDWMDLG
jgi:hypothetical protein